MKLLFQKINRKHILTFFIFSAFLFLIFQVTFAEGLGDALKNFFIWLFTGIANFILNLSNILILFSSIVFDNLLLISLNPKPFLDQDFVKVIWLTIRDLGNSAFIVAAIFMVFKYMTGVGKSFERSVVYLLIAIFSLNFSFFATRVIVDMGNVTAAVFYSPISISIQGDSADSYFAIAKKFYGDNNQAYSSVAIAIKQAITPSATEYSNVLTQAFSGSTMDGVFDGSGNMNVDRIENFDMMINYLTFVAFIVIVNIIFAKKFFTAGFMFLGRMLRIAYLAIISPIAFVALVIPDWGYNQFKRMWLLPVLQSAFCIAVYMIFLWLTVMVLLAPDFVSFATSDFDGLSGSNSGGSGNVTFISWALTLLVKIIFTYVLLGMGEKYGKQFCEGDMFGEGGLLGKLMKPAAAALGIARFALNPVTAITRRAVGSAGKRIRESEALKNYHSSGKFGSKVIGAGFRNLGGKMQNMKIGGVSDRDAQNARIQKLNELEEDLSPEQRDRLQKSRWKWKKLNSESVNGYIDPAKDKEYQEFKRRQTDTSLSKEDRERAKMSADTMIKGGGVASYYKEDEEKKLREELAELKRKASLGINIGNEDKVVQGQIKLIEKERAALEEKYQGAVKRSKQKNLSEQEKETARQEVKQMIAEGKIKEYSESKISEMGINPDAVKGTSFMAALIPAIGAQRNRALEYNEGRVKAAARNPELQRAEDKRKELTGRKVDADEKAKEEKDKIDEQIANGDFDGSGYNDMDEATVKELSALNDKFNNAKMQEQDASEKLEKIEKENQELLSNFLSSDENKGSSSFSVEVSDKIKDALGDTVHSDFMQKQDDLQVKLETAQTYMEKAGTSGDTAGVLMYKDEIDSIKSQIQKERQKVASEIKKANENDDAYADAKKIKAKAGNQVTAIEKEFKQYTKNRMEKIHAVIKAEHDQGIAILNQAVANTQKEKRNAHAKAKEGDVGGITAADAQIDTL